MLQLILLSVSDPLKPALKRCRTTGPMSPFCDVLTCIWCVIFVDDIVMESLKLTLIMPVGGLVRDFLTVFQVDLIEFVCSFNQLT